MPSLHKKPIINGDSAEHHTCHHHPTYPNRVTSSGANGEEDYPLVDKETKRNHAAPIFHGGTPLSKNALASECQHLRPTIPEKYRRISRPVPMMRPEYDVVVIGSGYGGAVAACRMARAGKSVCLLELGKERWPGEYPVDFASAAPEIHVSGDIENDSKIGQFDSGDRQGLYHLIVGQGQNAFVANGLGGTSLLNANVFLQADHRTLSQPVFPAEIRNDPSCLDEYYDLAREVLQPEIYPEDWKPLPKLKLLGEQAKLLGPQFESRFKRVPQTTTFKAGLNHMGVRQEASTLSGQDATGVNDWSKNSTLMNYLPDAWNHGTEIFCGCEVRYVKPCTEGQNKWTVHFAWHGDKRDKFKDAIYTQLMWVQAKEFLFMGAGTLGTTEILLRSCAYGLNLSDRLGTSMSGNGDILAFGYDGEKIANAIGTDDLAYLAENPVGPTINGIIDMRDEEVAPNVLDGYVIEEGAVPKALAHFLEVIYKVTPGKKFPHGLSLLEHVNELASKVSSALSPWHYGGALNRTMIYLIMSHDDNQATLSLKNNKPCLEFEGVERCHHVKELNNLLTKATGNIGASFIPNPFSSRILGQSEITVHPIGGANMSSDGTGLSGVTNHLGKVFIGNSADVYDGLVVVDGACVPAALGVNPLATITALAERSVRGVAEEKGLTIDYETRKDIINWAAPKKSWPMTDDMKIAQKAIANSRKTGGARFTEIMEGYLYVGDDIKDFEIAVEAAKGVSSTAKFYLSVDAWDINTLINKKNHAAMITGTFSCGALSKDPYMVLRGEFQLFCKDSHSAETENLNYKFDMISTSGEIIHFEGYKIIDNSIAFSVCNTWKAASTLYIKLTRKDGSTVGRGILTISAKNFCDELLTYDSLGETLGAKACVTKSFLEHFTKHLATPFLAPLESYDYHDASISQFYQRQPPTETIKLTAIDGVHSTMQMWTPQGVNRHFPILLVPGASTDYRIYALPTIAQNFVDYLLKRGYTVFCVNHRVGNTPAAKDGWTTYDARHDIAVATQYILNRTGASKIYSVVHCAGAQAMAAGLLDGTIKGIGGLTASQVFMHPIFARMNKIKANIIPSMSTLYNKLVGPWFDVMDGDDRDFMVNEMLRFYPEGGLQDVCHSIVCHRTELVFGRLWSHPNLNDATHENLGSLVGGVSMKNLKQLTYMGSHGHIVDNQNQTLLSPENIERLRDIPIYFIHGGNNTVYGPESTLKDYDLLLDKMENGESLYTRSLFPNKGHLDCWMGHSSFKDVYSQVEEHARATILDRHLQSRS